MRTFRLAVVKQLIVVVAVLASPVVGYAQQQATLIGTVTDATGAVLPGVTVTAIHEASGNTFVAVTDERGGYRLPVRTGGFRITAELAGFTTVTRTGLQLLLSQEAVVNFQLAVSTVQETVTVTGEAPLVDVTRSRSSGNIDTRQLQELPVNGRNFLDLTTLALGSRAIATGESGRPVPDFGGGSVARPSAFQINLDGQQVTQTLGQLAADIQPRFSRDAIAEFEFVSNRFDATQGRSTGAQVNVITKSGTNTPSGTFAGYFRDDSFNAKDFVAKRVLPYSNQQLSGTFGGPLRRNRIHFFASYEYEREPSTAVFNTPFPRFNLTFQNTRVDNKVLGRVDMQLSPRTRFTVRGSLWNSLSPNRSDGGATVAPYTESHLLRSWTVLPILTQVLSDRVVNEVKGGYYSGLTDRQPNVYNPNTPWKDLYGVTNIPLRVDFRGFSVGTSIVSDIRQETISVRDDLTISFNKGGRHDIKTGGEFYTQEGEYFTTGSILAGGVIDAQGGPIPSNIEDLFPVWNDVTTWNVAALSPIARQYSVGIGKIPIQTPKEVWAVWFQDDWKITPRLTLNLGLRYDMEYKSLLEDVVLEPFVPPGRGPDTDNIAPRVGVGYSLNDRTVLRGGFGKFFGGIGGPHYGTRNWLQIAIPQVLNDGRPDFTTNPFNGPPPTFEQVQQTLCSVVNRPGCRRLDMPSNVYHTSLQFPFSYQASAGVQRQLGDTMALEADYVYTGGRKEIFSRSTNLTYNPATGANYPFTDISRRPYPDWGTIGQWLSGGWSNFHSLQMLFSKRFSQRWQASGTYLLSGLWNAVAAPDTGFPLAPDMGGEYTLAASDQRHRATFNAIWDAGYGFQLSGLYIFGSGVRYETTYGGDLRRQGVVKAEGSRLRPDGTIVPRNNFVGDPIHRVDVRLQRRFNLVGRAKIDGIAELFNVFNHANYGTYTTVESNRRYGQPSQNQDVAYAPRTLQLGFRFSF